jgi:serine protease Do
MKHVRVVPIGIHALLVVLLLACDLNVSPRSNAEPAQESELFGAGGSPFRRIAQDVLPSVVNISAQKVAEEEKTFEFDYPFKEYFKDFEKFFGDKSPYRGPSRSLGSGIVVSEEGHILTNNHVIRGADKIVVTLRDKTAYEGDDVEVVGRDPRTDLAVLKVNANEKLLPVRLGDSDKIEIGDWAIAIGNPLGLNGSVTVGVISAKGRSGISLPEGPTQQDFIQTDASINPGNSGGPLLNIDGEVIGVNSAIATRTGYAQGVGFAIPINLARSVYTQLIEEGKVVRGWLGIFIRELAGNLIEAVGVKEGVLVEEVIPGSPAETSGMEAGDVIVEFNGRRVESIPQLQGVVAETPPGEEVTVLVIREGEEKTLKVEIEEMPEDVPVAGVEEVPEEEKGWLGLRVVSADSERARELGVDVEEGVVVVNVDPGSPADEAGIRRGDVILRIDKKTVRDFDSYERIEDELEGKKDPILFWIQKGGRKRFVAVSPE